MSGKILSVAALATVCFAATAAADLRGPAETPPASFKGQQYVDSRGCVFLRAGYGGRETWVPRIARDKKQLCGYAPSGRAVETAEAAPVAKTGTKIPSINTEASAPLPDPMQDAWDKTAVSKAGKPAAKTTSANPAAIPARAAYTVSNEGYRLTCPASTPVAQKFRVEGGGTRTLCTRGDGSLTGAAFPRLIGADAQDTDLGPDRWNGAATSLKTGQTITVTTGRGKTLPAPPPGYKLAWEDDRLNPYRGLQTARGIADQERIWTRKTPATLVADEVRPRESKVTVKTRRADGSVSEQPAILMESADGSRKVRLLAEAPLSKSTKSDSKAATTPKRVFIQVGTYGVAANAEGTAGRLKGLGLPVARTDIRGGSLRVVYAGPFATAAEAKSALAQLRGAGFGDAMILR